MTYEPMNKLALNSIIFATTQSHILNHITHTQASHLLWLNILRRIMRVNKVPSMTNLTIQKDRVVIDNTQAIWVVAPPGALRAGSCLSFVPMGSS